jgi:transposase
VHTDDLTVGLIAPRRYQHHRGAARDQLREAAAERYRSGASIRDVAEHLGVSYHKARTLLSEAAALRPRGGTHR